jgi:hypothetical protein
MFPALSADAVSRLLVPQDSIHSSKVYILPIKKDWLLSDMQMCHPKDPQNCNYVLEVAEHQLPSPQTWSAWQMSIPAMSGTICHLKL